MASQLNAPEAFSFKGEDWPLWIRRFERFRTATKQNKTTEDEQISCLVYCMGARAEKLYDSLDVAEPATYAKIVEALNNHFSAVTNLTDDIEALITHKQKEESVTTFIEELKARSIKAKIANLATRDLLRELFIIGLRDQRISDHLRYHTETLTLDKAFIIAKGMENRKAKEPNMSLSADAVERPQRRDRIPQENRATRSKHYTSGEGAAGTLRQSL